MPSDKRHSGVVDSAVLLQLAVMALSPRWNGVSTVCAEFASSPSVHVFPLDALVSIHSPCHDDAIRIIAIDNAIFIRYLPTTLAQLSQMDRKGRPACLEALIAC